MLSGPFTSFIGTPLFSKLRLQLQRRVDQQGPDSVSEAVSLVKVEPYTSDLSATKARASPRGRRSVCSS